MKAYRERRGIAPFILNLGTRWTWVVSIKTQPLYPPGQEKTSTHWKEGWVGPRAGLYILEKIKISCPGSDPIPRQSFPPPSHYTDYMTPDPSGKILENWSTYLLRGCDFLFSGLWKYICCTWRSILFEVELSKGLGKLRSIWGPTIRKKVGATVIT
jgi:hypothetical protein